MGITTFFDTSVLVATFWGPHIHHAASLQVFAPAQPETSACGIHSLAEVYRTLTRLPVRPPIAPEQINLFIQEFPARLTLIGLDPSEYLSTIGQISERKLVGGLIYDALLLACARKSGAETIYTWKVRHFRELAPDLANCIRTP